MSPTPNVPLLRKALEWAQTEAARPLPERQWVQGAYLVEPVSHAHFVAHEELLSRRAPGYVERVEELKPTCGTAYCIAGYVAQLHDERYAHDQMVGDVHSSDLAEQLLGLTTKQAGELFLGDNTIEDLREIFEKITGERL